VGEASHNSRIAKDDTRDPLGDLLSLEEIGPCSVVASEACRACYKRLEQPIPEEDVLHQGFLLYAIDGSPTEATRLDYREIFKGYACESLVIGGEEINLAVARPSTSKEIAAQGNKHKRALDSILRETGIKKPIIEETKEANDPMLIAIFGKDSYLPLAAFARRPGECNYVQITSEIKDENFIVTSLDDGIPRIAIVEAIRTLLDNREEDAGDYREVLTKLVEDEIAKKSSLFEAASEAQFIRSAYERVGEPKLKQLYLLGEEEPTAIKARMRTLLPECRLSDGRLARLVLALPEGPDPALQLLAITRGDLALPLASMHKSRGKVEFYNQQDLSEEEHVKMVELLAQRLKQEPYWTYSRPEQLRYKLEDLDYDDRIISAHMGKKYELLLTKEREVSYDLKGSRDRIKEDNEIIRAKLDEFLADPSYVPNPYPDSAPLKLALVRLGEREQGRRNFVGRFGVEQGLNALLGECDGGEETVIKKIQQLNSQGENFAAVLKNRKINTVRGDVSFKVSIKRNGTDYEVVTFYRFDAMLDADFTIFNALSFNFDATKPLFDREKIKFDIDERTAIIYEILRDLKPV
jgi:hypothetical protein